MDVRLALVKGGEALLLQSLIIPLDIGCKGLMPDLQYPGGSKDKDTDFGQGDYQVGDILLSKIGRDKGDETDDGQPCQSCDPDEVKEISVATIRNPSPSGRGIRLLQVFRHTQRPKLRDLFKGDKGLHNPCCVNKEGDHKDEYSTPRSPKEDVGIPYLFGGHGRLFKLFFFHSFPPESYAEALQEGPDTGKEKDRNHNIADGLWLCSGKNSDPNKGTDHDSHHGWNHHEGNDASLV